MQGTTVDIGFVTWKSNCTPAVLERTPFVACLPVKPDTLVMSMYCEAAF